MCVSSLDGYAKVSRCDWCVCCACGCVVCVCSVCVREREAAVCVAVKGQHLKDKLWPYAPFLVDLCRGGGGGGEGGLPRHQTQAIIICSRHTKNITEMCKKTDLS